MTEELKRLRRKPPNAGKGRKAGVPNKFTAAAKEVIEFAFMDIGGREALAEWARKHRTEFYKIYARLIPVDLHAKVETNLGRLSYAEERAREPAGAEAPGLASQDPLH